MSRMIIILGMLLSFAFTAARRASAQEITVVVNEAAPNTSITSEQLSEIFQKHLSRWSNGLSVEPVDLTEQAPEREQFSQMVFAKSTAQVKAWWQTQIFSGKSVPPIELTNDARVIAYVQLHAGAIGYVSPRASLVAGVRRLRVTR